MPKKKFTLETLDEYLKNSSSTIHDFSKCPDRYEKDIQEIQSRLQQADVQNLLSEYIQSEDWKDNWFKKEISCARERLNANAPEKLEEGIKIIQEMANLLDPGLKV